MPRRKAEAQISCDTIPLERFHAQTGDTLFRYDWYEICCFPYILCNRFWEFFMSVCTGSNMCLIYWLIIQWIVCKITKLTTPDPIIFPYYFYMFAQVFIATALFAYLWYLFGNTVIIPYFQAFYKAFTQDEHRSENSTTPNTTRLSFRRYCFRKGELFEAPPIDTTKSLKNGILTAYPRLTVHVFAIIIEVFMDRIL